jgi:catechol 2,3-dioxygenase-like lactoylglutathione lyase family enzyme
VFERVAAIIPVRDLDAALERYRRLGFDVSADESGARYAFVDRDAVAFHLTEWPDHDPSTSGSAVYLYVDDVDAVHAEWAKADVGGRLTQPSDTGWGLREFTYVDPDGTLHRVGSPL